ncbi:MAG TPA: hypothetical protein VNW29_00260, partial [Candidatus Sulfotelmatobacter sp.]|nr:hypothetical protein [Candidatus Sulfotelmatobacter sp.]
MDSARPGNPLKFLTLKEAAQKLAVSIDVLIKWNHQNILKPTITPEGEVGYTEEQINHFIQIRNSSQQTEVLPPTQIEPGRAHKLVIKSSKPNHYQKFVQWIGKGFYKDDFIKDYLKSQIKDSLTITVEKPSFKLPPRRNMLIAVAMLLMLVGVWFTQQYQIKFFVSKIQNAINSQAESISSPNVLGSQTSKLKLIGRIIFRLPVVLSDQVSVGSDLHVDGKGVFKGNITAPNIIYDIKGGNNVSIGGDKQTPTISVELPALVTSFQGQTGQISLNAGSGIAINGTSISSSETLATIAAKGGCTACVLAPDIAQNLTISGAGQVAAESIKSGIITTGVGGTGLTTYNTGDLLYAQSSNTLASLPIGTSNGQILEINNGLPVWSSISLTSSGTNSTNSGASLIGVYSNFTNSNSTNLQNVLKDLDTAIIGAGISPFGTANDITSGGYIRPNNISNNFVLGGNGTPEGSTLFFRTSNANLILGTSNSQNGTLTFNSVGSSTASITTNSNGNLLIPNSNVGIKTIPSDLDADGNPFALEVHGSIGPDQNAVYDLGSPTKQYRNLYLTGQTTSGGNITIANPSPTITFTDTDPGQNQYVVNVDNSQYTITNTSTGQVGLLIDASGNLNFAGGSTSTGCTVTNATGDLTCSGNITTTNTSGTVGFFSRNNGTATISPATSGDNINTTGTITGGGLIAGTNGLTAAGTITLSGLTTNGPVYTTTGGILASEAKLAPIRGGTGLDASSAPNGSLLIGNGTGFSLATITGTPNQVNVTNAPGTITLSLPQNIDTTAAPTFAALSLTKTNNQITLGATGNTTILSANAQTAPRTLTIPTLTGSDTFVLTNQTQTLSNKLIGSTGLIFTGAATDIGTQANANLNVSAGTGQIILSSTTQLTSLSGVPASATSLCRDNVTNQISACPANASGVSLQLAYNQGNTITTTSGRNIGFTLYDQSSDAGVATSFTLTNAGTATAFVINNTNAANNILLSLQSNGTPNFTVDKTGTLATNGNITQSGATIFSTGTGNVSLNGNTSVLGTNTFTVGTGASSLGGSLSVTGNSTIGGTLGVTGNTALSTLTTSGATTIGGTLTFNGATTDITTGTNEDLTVTPNGIGKIVLSNTTVLGTLPAAGGNGTTLCRDNTSNQITACPANASGVSLQLAYQSGNTINATDSYGNIGFTLAAGSTRQLTLTNAGTATSAFVINDTNAANQNALTVESSGTPTLTINENGSLTTSGVITSQTTTNQLVLGTTNTTTINSVASTAPVTATIPALSGNDTFIFASQSQTLTNKTFVDNSTTFANSLDNTKKFILDASLITTGTTRTISIPDATGTICLTTGNCAGSGGIVGGSGTQYHLALFTTTGSNIGDSHITDNGTVITALSGVNIGNQSGTDSLSLLRFADATGVSPTQNSNLFNLQGAYWTGATSNNVGFSLENKVTSTAPAYELAFLNNAGTEVANINNNGALALAATANQVVLGTTNTTTINAAVPAAPVIVTIPALSSNDTFIFANQTQTLSNKIIGSTGLTFSGATADLTTTSNANLTVTPNGTGKIVLSNTTVLGTLPSAGGSGTTLCRDNTSNQITACPANALNVTLQQAYQVGNTINATDSYGNIAFTLATGNARQLTLTNAGTASSAFVINTPAAGSQNALTIQANGINTLTVDENGNLATSGTIATNTGGTVTSNGLLTASNGFTQTTGALNLVATSGSLSLAGLSATSINTGTNNILFTSGNFNTTATGINATAIGSTTPSTAAFTTLTSSGNTTLSSFTTAGVVTNNASGLLSTVPQLGVAVGGTGINATNAANGNLLIGNGIGFSLATITGTPNQVNVTNGAGAIRLSLPQDIAATSSPTFASLNLTNITNQLVLGTTNRTTISSVAPTVAVTATIPALSSNDTFIFANQTQTLSNKTIGSTGLTFAGAATDITTGPNENLTISPDGTGQIILNTLTQIPNLSATVGNTVLCRNTTNQFSICSSNALNVTLQQAYDSGNTITTTDARNISFTLANTTTPSNFSITNQGTATAFVINNTNAANNTL